MTKESILEAIKILTNLQAEMPLKRTGYLVEQYRDKLDEVISLLERLVVLDPNIRAALPKIAPKCQEIAQTLSQMCFP